jgi:hypothetical protein
MYVSSRPAWLSVFLISLACNSFSQAPDISGTIYPSVKKGIIKMPEYFEVAL